MLINDTKIRWNSMCELSTILKLKAQMYKQVFFFMKEMDKLSEHLEKSTLF